MTTTLTTAIELRGLEKSYGEVQVLRGVDLDVAPGSIFALLGSNGAGKTTVIRILATLLRADAGTATVNGFDVAAHLRPGRQWWMLLVWLFGVVFYATNVINYLGTFLAIAGVLTNTWLLIILADYFICRRWLRLGRTEGIEFREEEVRACLRWS